MTTTTYATLVGADDDTSPPVTVDAVLEVEAVLARFIDHARREVESLDPSITTVVDVIEGLVRAGGKRLRPRFVAWGHRVASAHADHRVHCLGAAVEMLHTYALLHDDVMDRSKLRRGQRTAHEALASQHRASRWSGDADWFGKSAAIVAGDLAGVWAQQLFESAVEGRLAAPRARAMFRELQAEAITGQYVDLRAAQQRQHLTSIEDRLHESRRVALLKSGRYTVTRPLQLGAVLGGATPAQLVALEQYGDALGSAFQLRDDVLGLMGDESTTGKCADDDLREGKCTVVILEALRGASDSERSVIEAALGAPHVEHETVARVREIVTTTGALRRIETEIRDLLVAAMDATANLPSPTREALVALAGRATDRQS